MTTAIADHLEHGAAPVNPRSTMMASQLIYLTNKAQCQSEEIGEAEQTLIK